MYDDDKRMLLITTAVAAAAFVVLVGMSVLLDRATCLNTWGESGQPVRWGVTSGCRLEVELGVWRPAPRRVEITTP